MCLLPHVIRFELIYLNVIQPELKLLMDLFTADVTAVIELTRRLQLLWQIFCAVWAESCYSLVQTIKQLKLLLVTIPYLHEF